MSKARSSNRRWVGAGRTDGRRRVLDLLRSSPSLRAASPAVQQRSAVSEKARAEKREMPAAVGVGVGVAGWGRSCSGRCHQRCLSPQMNSGSGV